jgi:hypothetical protein
LLQNLYLYEYVKVVQKRSSTNRTSCDIDFTVDHPEYGQKTQIIRTPNFPSRTVTLPGQLSEQQSVEDRILGGHPETLAMRDDVAAILLGLFVPWDILLDLFDDIMDICDDSCVTECDKTSHAGVQACADIWAAVRPSLPEHVHAQNIELLRKSQEDVSVDKAERSAFAPIMEDTMEDVLFSDLEDGNDDQPFLPQEKNAVNNDALRLACHLVRSR